MKAIKKLALLLVAFLLISPVLTANAGVVERSILLVTDGQFNSANWFDAESIAYVEDGKLMIPADSTHTSGIVSKVLAQEDTGYETMFTWACGLHFSQLPQGQTYILAMGLDSIDACSGEPGNVELQITNDSQLQMGIVVYDDAGEAQELAAKKYVGVQPEQAFTLELTATTDRRLDVALNGSSLFSLNNVEGLEGRIGFLQTGGCSLQISDCYADFTHYDRPENPDFTEDFETEIYNNNLFTMNFITGVRFPSYIAVEEMGGSNVLRFYNSKLGYWGTKYTYSNFELSFDVPYYLRESIRNENGTLTEASTQEFLVSVGDDAMDFSGFGYATSVEAIRFTADTVHGLNHAQEKFRVKYSDKGYFDPATNDGFSVLIRMMDGHLEVGMKALDGEEFDILAEADYEDFRTGYIKLWSVNDGNFAIDNVKLTNLDKDANTVQVGFAGATLVQEDYDYREPEPVFRPVEQTQSEVTQIKWLPVLLSAVGAALIIVVSFLISTRLKKKQKKEAA